MNKPTSKMTGLFWRRAAKYPPFLVRMLARHKRGAPLTDEEIGSAAGLSNYEVASIAQCRTWEPVKVGEMRRFLEGCRIDFTDSKCMKRVVSYLKTPNRFRSLQTSPMWKTVYEPLIKKFLK